MTTSVGTITSGTTAAAAHPIPVIAPPRLVSTAFASTTPIRPSALPPGSTHLKTSAAAAATLGSPIYEKDIWRDHKLYTLRIRRPDTAGDSFKGPTEEQWQTLIASYDNEKIWDKLNPGAKHHLSYKTEGTGYQHTNNGTAIAPASEAHVQTFQKVIAEAPGGWKRESDAFPGTTPSTPVTNNGTLSSKPSAQTTPADFINNAETFLKTATGTPEQKTEAEALLNQANNLTPAATPDEQIKIDGLKNRLQALVPTPTPSPPITISENEFQEKVAAEILDKTNPLSDEASIALLKTTAKDQVTVLSDGDKPFTLGSTITLSPQRPAVIAFKLPEGPLAESKGRLVLFYIDEQNKGHYYDPSGQSLAESPLKATINNLGVEVKTSNTTNHLNGQNNNYPIHCARSLEYLRNHHTNNADKNWFTRESIDFANVTCPDVDAYRTSLATTIQNRTAKTLIGETAALIRKAKHKNPTQLTRMEQRLVAPATTPALPTVTYDDTKLTGPKKSVSEILNYPIKQSLSAPAAILITEFGSSTHDELLARTGASAATAPLPKSGYSATAHTLLRKGQSHAYELDARGRQISYIASKEFVPQWNADNTLTTAAKKALEEHAYTQLKSALTLGKTEIQIAAPSYYNNATQGQKAALRAVYDKVLQHTDLVSILSVTFVAYPSKEAIAREIQNAFNELPALKAELQMHKDNLDTAATEKLITAKEKAVAYLQKKNNELTALGKGVDQTKLTELETFLTNEKNQWAAIAGVRLEIENHKTAVSALKKALPKTAIDLIDFKKQIDTLMNEIQDFSKTLPKALKTQKTALNNALQVERGLSFELYKLRTTVCHKEIDAFKAKLADPLTDLNALQITVNNYKTPFKMPDFNDSDKPEATKLQNTLQERFLTLNTTGFVEAYTHQLESVAPLPANPDLQISLTEVENGLNIVRVIEDSQKIKDIVPPKQAAAIAKHRAALEAKKLEIKTTILCNSLSKLEMNQTTIDNNKKGPTKIALVNQQTLDLETLKTNLETFKKQYPTEPVVGEIETKYNKLAQSNKTDVWGK